MNARIALFVLVCAAVSMPGVPVSAEGPAASGCELTVVRAWYDDRSQVEALAGHAEPWEIHHDKGWLLIGADAATRELLAELGFRIEVDPVRTAEVCAPQTRLPGQTEGIPGYPCYRTVEETFTSAQDLVASHPDLASWIDAGDSWEKTTPGGSPGYDMMVLRLTNDAVAGTPPAGTTGKPKLFVTAAIHAREYTTAELVTRFAEHLVLGYGTDPDATWLLDEHEIHLMLHTNPDGRKHAETGDLWRKNTNESYCGATSADRGADLNRNFEFQWACCGGSSSYACSETYHGPAAATEPEVQAAQDYLRSIFPDQRDPELGAAAPADATGVYLDIHSYSELVLWPWGFTSSAPGNGPALRAFGRRLAYFNGYEPDQAIGLYPTDGTTIDFGYGDLGVASLTFELGDWFFQDCASFESTILPDNLAALTYAAKVARTPYLTPSGPEVVGASAVPSVVAPGQPVTIQATVDDTRFNNSNGSEPTQPIAAAGLFVDTPPWQAGATPVAMTAVDGAFDTPTEAVEAVLDTGGLADGRHTVYLRGRDADGADGPVTAVFVWVLDPASAAHVAGTVVSADTGLPLAATVATGIFTTETDAADGSYDLMLPAGVYDVTASADGHGSRTAAGLATTAGAVTGHDFELSPYRVAIEDDAEHGVNGWNADGLWSITDEDAASPTHSWTDSPGAQYTNNRNDSLTSPPVDLLDTAGVVLEFSHIYDLESGYDYGYVEVTADGGASWSTAASYDGTHTTGWERVVLPLPGLDHADHARIRFRIDTDYSVTRDGWHIDDIVLRGFDDAPAGLLFRGRFEGGDTAAWTVTVP